MINEVFVALRHKAPQSNLGDEKTEGMVVPW
jgi:hypothetical protein